VAVASCVGPGPVVTLLLLLVVSSECQCNRHRLLECSFILGKKIPRGGEVNSYAGPIMPANRVKRMMAGLPGMAENPGSAADSFIAG
jgi:hypothetical protein